MILKSKGRGFGGAGFREDLVPPTRSRVNVNSTESAGVVRSSCPPDWRLYWTPSVGRSRFCPPSAGPRWTLSCSPVLSCKTSSPCHQDWLTPHWSAEGQPCWSLTWRTRWGLRCKCPHPWWQPGFPELTRSSAPPPSLSLKRNAQEWSETSLDTLNHPDIPAARCFLLYGV